MPGGGGGTALGEEQLSRASYFGVVLSFPLLLLAPPPLPPPFYPPPPSPRPEEHSAVQPPCPLEHFSLLLGKGRLTEGVSSFPKSLEVTQPRVEAPPQAQKTGPNDFQPEGRPGTLLEFAPLAP